MAKVKVQITESDGEFFATPATIAAAPNDHLRIINATKEDLVFRIECPAAPTSPFNGDQIEVIKKKSKKDLAIQNTAVDESYPFQIHMLKSGKKAKGHSDPILIIDNP